MEEKSFKKHGVSLNVVGFPYCSDLAGCVDEFLAGALGHSLTICPQPSNPADKTAIRAFDWQGRHVGYVAHYCKPAAWALLRGSGRSRLKGKVVKADIEHHCLTIECTVKTVGEIVIEGEGDPEIDAIVKARAEAKKAKNWPEADRIRDELKARGIEVIDTAQGAKWRRI